MAARKSRKQATTRTRAKAESEPAESLPKLLRIAPALMGVVAAAIAMATLFPNHHGPGITCDEPYFALLSKKLVHAARTQGLRYFALENVRENFPWRPGAPPFHPPLGLWAIGWTHHLFDPSPDNAHVAVIATSRLAAPLAFGVLVWLVGRTAARLMGPREGIAASFCVAVSPRLFAEAHLATLDLGVSLAMLAALWTLPWATRGPSRWWRIAAAGIVWGFALLTKITALLLAPVVVAWCFVHFRGRAPGILAIWGGAALATMYALWPFLWLAPWDHLLAYVATTSDRAPLNVFYMGRVWRDVDVPRHYAPVMFLATMPIGFVVLGIWGVWANRREIMRDRIWSLLSGSWLFVLLVFCWPSVPVYDGIRLFLVTVPLWAYAVAAGAKACWRSGWMQQRTEKTRAALGACFLASQCVGVITMHPFQLSYYGAQVGGLVGAERLGFETTYWGDTVNETLLESLLANEKVIYGPNLAPYQAPWVGASSMSLVATKVELVGWDPQNLSSAESANYAVVYRRRADLSSLGQLLDNATIVAEVRRQGVWLGRIYRLRASDPFGAKSQLPGAQHREATLVP